MLRHIRMRNFLIALSLLAGTTLMPVLASAQVITGDVNPNASATICVNLQNDLSRGKSDSQTSGETSILQMFLQSTSTPGGNTPYLMSDPTGFFGIQTENAVKQFQADRQLLSSGFVGPLTRAKIKALSCGGAVPATFSATPSSGPAPLTVRFASGVGNAIDFGDGTSELFYYCLAIGCPTQGFNIEHTYSSAGTYTARALYGQNQTVGTTTITVTPGTVTPPPAAECTDLQNDLSYRFTDSQTNGEVSLLQSFFQSAISPATGTPYLTGEPTGFFGQLTKAAVIQFQKDNGLSATGTVDSATRAKIKEISCGTTPPPPPPIAECTDLQNDLAHRSTDSQTNGEVSLLQAFFQSVTSPTTGVQYLTGEPTGFFGQLTKAAVIQFQADNGLRATGVAGPATRAKIRNFSCGDTPPPPPQTCNVEREMQNCTSGAYAARIGQNCAWSLCPSNSTCNGDLMVCPDGTTVRRTPPSCSFTPCSGSSLQAPDVSSFTADATSVEYGGSTNLSWNVTPTSGISCTLSTNAGTPASVPTGNADFNTGTLTATTKYALMCSSNSGPSAGRDVTVAVGSKEISCLSAQQPQYVYGYGKVDAGGLPWIRLQGNCSYFTGYSVFDTGWVRGTQLSKSGNCPAGLGWPVTASANLDKGGLNVVSSYGSGYNASCVAKWPASFQWPASSYADTRPGPTVDLAQSSVSSQGEASISWNSTNADSCVIAYSTDGLTFTSWKFGTSGSGVPMSQISGFNNSGSWVFRATCTGNGTPAVDKVTHTIISQPGGE